MSEPEDSPDDTNMEDAVAEAAEIVGATETLTANMREFLESYVDGFIGKHPEIMEGLQSETAQSALSDAFDETLDVLDDEEEWTETDLLTIASQAILLAISLGAGAEEDGEEPDNG